MNRCVYTYPTNTSPGSNRLTATKFCSLSAENGPNGRIFAHYQTVSRIYIIQKRDLSLTTKEITKNAGTSQRRKGQNTSRLATERAADQSIARDIGARSIDFADMVVLVAR